jgi:ribonucleoside-diphosphate reductase alpha chain
MSMIYGPSTPACDAIHANRYRMPGEDFRSAMVRVSSSLSDNAEHFKTFKDILLNMRFMPAGRIQSAMGSTKIVTAYNCFVSGNIEDSYTHGDGSIMARATQAAATMRLGGGIGYDFSSLRPRGELIRKLQSFSSGPVSFMHIYDAVGNTTAASGHRRGAQMGVLRVDHPDIEEFIRAKQNSDRLTSFNISVAVTDEFMEAVEKDAEFSLRWSGKEYRKIYARVLWDAIMRSTYDWSEPGVLFIDRINKQNNLRYCETIFATNPCGEQPLPPFGACLLGSFNLTKYLSRSFTTGWKFNFTQFATDIPHVVRAMDNVIDRARYPLYEQEKEALSKRRMGLGITGLANAVEALGHPFGSKGFLDHTGAILETLRDVAYRTSARLAKEKSPFPLYHPDHYLDAPFIRALPDEVRELIESNGIRNSHLLSIAPTGTISFAADNISSGIEPVYEINQTRMVNFPEGPSTVELTDYGAQFLGVKGKVMRNVTPEEHLAVLETASQYVDSAVSKTCNLPEDVSWEDFKNLYHRAWKAGCKGCTTYREGGYRSGIIKAKEPEEPTVITGALRNGDACTIDPVTGARDCS